MACSACGSNGGCGCANNGTIIGVVLNRPSCTPCGPSDCCGPSVPATPQPFYNCAPACPEQHGQRVTINQFAADIKIIDSWNVPACNESAVVSADSLSAIVVGSYIWNPEFGYFEITAFNVNRSQITILNHCNDGNAAAGTNVPSCTEFTVTVPPCDCGDSNQVCVAIDFTAPDNGDCIDITLTSTVGLTASDTISIGTGFYFLQAIKPNDVVTICNQGQGITPGTPVIALDAQGNYQYCIGIISTNVCDRTAEEEIRLIGCNGDGVTVPLDCSTPGWVPTELGGDVENLACRPVGVYAECARLTAQLNLTDGDPTYTNIDVSDSSAFVVGDVVEFAGANGWTLLITNIPDATHLDGTISPTPSFNTNIPIDTLFCLQNCCDSIAAEVAALPFTGGSGNLTDGAFTVGPGVHDHTTPAMVFNIVNPSATQSMRVHVILKMLAAGFASVATTPANTLQTFELNYTIDGGGVNAVGNSLSSYLTDNTANMITNSEVVEDQFQVVAPGATMVFSVTGVITNYPMPTIMNDGQYDGTQTVLTYSYIGVPA